MGMMCPPPRPGPAPGSSWPPRPCPAHPQHAWNIAGAVTGLKIASQQSATAFAKSHVVRVRGLIGNAYFDLQSDWIFPGHFERKKSEFNYHYSKKHHGTECLRPPRVCFTPFPKVQATGDATGMWRGRPAAPRALHQLGPRRQPAPPAPSGQPPARLRQDECSGGITSVQPRPGVERVFFYQVTLFLPKRIFSSNCLFFQGKHNFQLHFSGFPLKNEKQMLLHTVKTWKNV